MAAHNNVSQALLGQFAKGIVTLDKEAVSSAIEAGVDPGQRLVTSQAEVHPLELLLMRGYAGYQKMPGAPKITEQEFNARSTALVDLLLDRGVKLVEEIPGSRYMIYPADSIIASRRTDEVLKVVAHTIAQSLETRGPVYQPETLQFIDEYMGKRARAGLPTTEADVEKAIAIVEQLHDRLRSRLENPTTAVENYLASKIEDLGYWTKAFERPPIQFVDQEAAGPQGLPGGIPPEMAQAMGGGIGAMPQGPGGNAMGALGLFIRTLELKDPKEVLEEINGMVGMEDCKKAAQSIVFRAKFDEARSQEGLSSVHSFSSVIEGNEGTGRTGAARRQAELLFSLGMVRGNYAEVTRDNIGALLSDPTGGRLSEALLRTADVIFIDNVDTLSQKYGMGPASAQLSFFIDDLTAAAERHNKTVIFSGNQKDLNQFFLENPVLKNQITRWQKLPDYTLEQLGQILDKQAGEAGLKFADDAKEAALQKLAPYQSSNIRAIKSLLDQLPDRMAERLFSNGTAVVSSKEEALTTVTVADVQAVTRLMAGKTAPLGFDSEPAAAPAPQMKKHSAGF